MSKTLLEGITVLSAFDYFCERFRYRYLTDLSEINHKGERNLVIYSCISGIYKYDAMTKLEIKQR